MNGLGDFEELKVVSFKKYGCMKKITVSRIWKNKRFNERVVLIFL